MSSAERRTLYLTSRLRRAVAVFDDEMRIRAITVLCADPGTAARYGESACSDPPHRNISESVVGGLSATWACQQLGADWSSGDG
jgi:hypothetical protein